MHALGYCLHADHIEIDDYYSRPDVDFMETVECLRVRRRDGFAEVTYKPGSTAATVSDTGVISKQEINVALATGQADAANQLLTMLGMRHLARVEKHRREYRHVDNAGVTVAIDTVTDAGSFLEVEVLTAEPDGAAERLNHVEQQLGSTDLPIVTLPYRDLVMGSAVVSGPHEPVR